jgi:hypothetical protein
MASLPGFAGFQSGRFTDCAFRVARYTTGAESSLNNAPLYGIYLFRMNCRRATRNAALLFSQ